MYVTSKEEMKLLEIHFSFTENPKDAEKTKTVMKNKRLKISTKLATIDSENVRFRIYLFSLNKSERKGEWEVVTCS